MDSSTVKQLENVYEGMIFRLSAIEGISEK